MSQELTARFWQTSSQSFLYSGSPGEINLSDKYLRPKYHISTFSHSDPYTFNAKRSKARIPCFYVFTQYFSIIFLHFYRHYQISKAKIPNINILPFSKQRYQNFHFHFQRCRLLNENVLSKRKFLFPISLMSTSFGDKRKRTAAKSPSFVLTENDKYLI